LLSAQKQKLESMKTETNSYKKSIIKEQESNETLTIMMNKRKSEVKNFEKSLKLVKEKIDLLQQEYNKFNRMLKETENLYSRISNVIDSLFIISELNIHLLCFIFMIIFKYGII
jgi:uncharacterized protein YllA (UPF0747 family)